MTNEREADLRAERRCDGAARADSPRDETDPAYPAGGRPSKVGHEAVRAAGCQGASKSAPLILLEVRGRDVDSSLAESVALAFA